MVTEISWRMTNAFVRVETGKARRGSETFTPKKKEEGGEGNPRGRRVPSPQGSRIFLSRGPVQASSLGCVSFHSCRGCALGFSSAPLQGCSLLQGSGSSWFWSLVPKQFDCAAWKEVRKSHRCLLSSPGELWLFFFPAQQLENRKSNKSCWLLLPMAVPSRGH